MNKISPQGVLEIAEHEGIVIGPYKDSVGVWTYGVGHTASAGTPDPFKMERVNTFEWTEGRVRDEVLKALEVFDKDLDSYEERVNTAIKVPLKQHQFDALVSFDFNTGGIYRANLTKDINKGVMNGNGFMGWVKPKEIIKRRRAEQALFRSGDYSANGDFIPIYDVTSAGKTRFRFRISGKELERMMLQAKAKHTVAKPLPNTILHIVWAGLKNFFKQP